MDNKTLFEEVTKLRKALENIESRLSAGEVPMPAVEDFKMAVDHIRTTLWAMLTTPKEQEFEVSGVIAKFRLKRAEDICKQVSMDIDANDLTIESPELHHFFTVLRNLYGRLDRFLRSGM
jgi:hypothetical protein